MAYKKILPGGFRNDLEWNKLEDFVSKHLRLTIGVNMTPKEVEDVSIKLYCWVQERKRKNAPIINENDVWTFAEQCAEISESF